MSEPAVKTVAVQVSRSWRLSPDMQWPRRRRKGPEDPDLVRARTQVANSMSAAVHSRDTELRKLREERGTVVRPLQEVHRENHLADLALRALIARRR